MPETEQKKEVEIDEIAVRAVKDFKVHETAKLYFKSEADTRALFKGNQAGGTKICMTDACWRLLGIHPVDRRNRLEKPIRCVSKCLPKSDDDEENQQYVEFKRIFPTELIKKDVTARSATMVIRDRFGGSDKKIEFMSSKQDIDAFMSVQRSAYYQDEEIDRTKWDENHMRLLREGGDVTINLTPVRGLDWTYDLIWKRARRIYRSKAICERFGFPRIEETDSTASLEAFCWATDDNPIMDKATIHRIFADIDDEDELAMRRYGVFRQVSGRVYKLFDPLVHIRDFDSTFKANEFQTYWHYRIIDFHPSKPWYVSYVAVTPHHEWFVWNEMVARHDNVTTVELRDKIKAESLVGEDNECNRATLIDPLAKMKQANTGYSVFDDLRRGDYGLRRIIEAETKNESARMNVRMRLKNALECKRPGNNLRPDNEYPDPKYGYYLPTLWFLSNCKTHKEHFMNWRYIEWRQENVKAVKDVKRLSEKWSDMCRNIEFIAGLNPTYYDMPKTEYHPSSLYQGRRMAA